MHRTVQHKLSKLVIGLKSSSLGRLGNEVRIRALWVAVLRTITCNCLLARLPCCDLASNFAPFVTIGEVLAWVFITLATLPHCVAKGVTKKATENA